jgi:hypothetical protein
MVVAGPGKANFSWSHPAGKPARFAGGNPHLRKLVRLTNKFIPIDCLNINTNASKQGM